MSAGLVGLLTVVVFAVGLVKLSRSDRFPDHSRLGFRVIRSLVAVGLVLSAWAGIFGGFRGTGTSGVATGPTSVSSAPASSTSTSATSTTTPAPAPGPSPATVATLADNYLSQRENADSALRTSPTSWLESVRSLLTTKGFATLASAAQHSSPGIAWVVGHQNGYSVRISAQCSPDLEAGSPTSTLAVIQCSLADTTIGSKGAVPSAWPFTGPQPPALLVLNRVGSHWLISADETGLAQ